MLKALREGEFITAARLRRVGVVLIAFYAAAFVALFATSPDGWRDRQARPIGTDFFAFWTAGRMVTAGEPYKAYDWEANQAAQRALADDPSTPYFPFLHPPQVLLVTTLLAAPPYLLALALFVAGGAYTLLRTLRTIAPHKLTPLVTLAAPALFLNATHGQTGLILASLFGAAAVLIDRRPLLAGICFGLIAIKPQFGLLIPMALAAGGRWRAFAAAGATVLAQAAAATLAFGPGIWLAFAEKTAQARQAILEQGAVGWEKNHTLFAAMMAWGADPRAAYAAQAALALVVVAAVVAAWRGKSHAGLKCAFLIAGALLVSPYMLYYDMAILLPAIAIMSAHAMRESFLPYEKSALAFAAIAPLFAFQIAGATTVPVGFLAIFCLFVAMARRTLPMAFYDRRAAA